MPVKKAIKDSVISGSTNGTGVLHVKGILPSFYLFESLVFSFAIY
jgi:hypothetical protein